MKRLGLLLLSTLTILLFPTQASAHVLITDTTKTKGAILHINPDDDPIAGQPASFFFDMQDQDITEVTLTINSTTSESKSVPLQISGSLATAEYIFPSQGAYDMTFAVQTVNSSYTFNYSQRVSRGISSGALDKPSYAWAEMLLLASGLGFVLLMIVAVNRRTAIKLQSKL